MDYKKKYEAALEKNALLEKKYKVQVEKKNSKLPSLFNTTNSSFQFITPIYDKNDSVVDYYYKNVNTIFLNNMGKTREEVIGKRGTDIIGFIEDY